MSTAAKQADRFLIVIVSGIAVLVVVALAVVFTRGEPEALDESTPAGTVQRYSTAVLDGDTAAATTYLTTTAQTECRATPTPPPPSRVVLISTNEQDDSALVRVSVVMSQPGGPFGPSEYEREDRFSLQKVDGPWRIDQVPYGLLVCTGMPGEP